MFYMKYFRTEEFVLSIMMWVFSFSYICFIFEKYLNWKLILTFTLSILMFSMTFPIMGMPLLPLPLVSYLRFSIPFMEMCWEKNNNLFMKMKSFLYLSLQTLAYIMSVMMSTFYLIMS